MPSALHLFNKDLLCSETLIQSVCTQAETHTSHLFFFFPFFFRHSLQKRKKVRDVGLEMLGALFVNSHSNKRRTSRLARGGRNANYGLLCLRVALAHRHRCNYRLVAHVFVVRCEQRETQRMERSGENFLPFTRLQCGAHGVTHALSQEGKAGQSGGVARRVSPSASVQVNPFRPLTPPALCVTHMPGREAGCRGQGPACPFHRERPQRRADAAPRGRQRGQRVPGMRRCNACRAASQTLARVLALFTERPGGPRLPTATTRGLII